MAFEILKHINIYPLGEQIPGKVLEREQFPRGFNFEGFLKNGTIRPTADETSTPLADSDALGWKGRAAALAVKIEVLLGDPDKAAVDSAKQNASEVDRLNGVCDKLREDLETSERTRRSLTEQLLQANKQLQDLGAHPITAAAPATAPAEGSEPAARPARIRNKPGPKPKEPTQEPAAPATAPAEGSEPAAE